MPCQDMNGTSSLPALAKLNFWHRNGDSGLSEDEGLFIGYGHVPSAIHAMCRAGATHFSR